MVNTPGGDGATALHFARTTEVANVLLDYNADLDARDMTTLLPEPSGGLTLPLMLRNSTGPWCGTGYIFSSCPRRFVFSQQNY